MDVNLASTISERSTTTSSATSTAAADVPATLSSKTLKRCLSVPIIHHLPVTTAKCSGNADSNCSLSMTTRSAAAAAAAAAQKSTTETGQLLDTPTKQKITTQDSSAVHARGTNINKGIGGVCSMNINIPRSNPSSREVSPAPVFNIFASRARRYSASYSPHSAANGSVATGVVSSAGAPLRLTPRVSQLRQEECVDMNSREVNHEREVHSTMQMSQSWEDLTLVAENWSCKSDEFSNPLQVTLPAGATSCSSPSPTSNRAGLRLPFGLSPSPTRRTFATRRSMSPIAMRPSQLCSVKRKFELDDNNCSNWNIYSPPPLKKITTESRGSSPICQSPSSVCPSPDSGTYDGRITPKLFISKLCTTNTNSTNCSSPMPTQTMAQSSSSGGSIEATANPTLSTLSSSSSSSAASSICGGSEPMCIGTNIDEGISISETDDKLLKCGPPIQRMSTDMQDEATLMDDMKSETSSIGGCSSISTESSSYCDNGSKTTAANFLNKFILDDGFSANATTSSLNKNFFINKQGLSGPKKFIVNHDNLPNSSSSFSRNSSTENMDSININNTIVENIKGETVAVAEVSLEPKV